MMKPKTCLIGSLALSMLVFTAWAQQPKKDQKKETKPAPIKQVPVKTVPVTLGISSYSGGEISKKTFDQLVLQGLKSDSGRIVGFDFSYAEHGVYEDSTGNLIDRVELLSEYCKGDTLSSAIRGSITERTKRGDTVYFDNIKVIASDGKAHQGKGMKFIITK